MADVRKFKGTTIIDWDSEPTQERPSEFAESSLFMSPSGLTREAMLASRSANGAMLERPRARPAQKKGGGNTFWWALSLVAAITAAGFYGMLHYLRG